jgi:thiol-disulfide isomerase/thioredoxin
MRNETKRRLGLTVACLAIFLAIMAVEYAPGPRSTVPPPPANLPDHLRGLPGAPDFGGAVAWVNTPDGQDIDLVEQRGDVVLVDFWTYSCINCIRTFAYLRAWHDAYADDGLVIVGVHTPEFGFERDLDNVRDAAQRYGIEWPVAIDNDYAIWNAYHNRFWPAKYLVDEYGKIRYTHFGEGAYEETDARIRELLTEAGRAPGDASAVEDPDVSGPGGITPELYAGTRRHAIGNPEGYEPGRTTTYAPPEDVPADRIFLVGAWHNANDHVRAEDADAAVLVRFRAGGSNFVADGPDGQRVRLTLDGQAFPSNRTGTDVQYDGEAAYIQIDAARSYDYYGGPFEEHLVELRVGEGFELYSFAFSSTPTTNSTVP